MSLAVVVKGPEGLVLAADTRITVSAPRKGDAVSLVVNYDNATKVLGFSESHGWVGAVTYGDALIGTRTAHSFVPELELEMRHERCTVLEYAQFLSAFTYDATDRDCEHGRLVRTRHMDHHSGPRRRP